MNMVIEGLENLDSILCGVMTSVLMEIAQVGLTFVPGVGPATRATRLAIQAAKSFDENGLKGKSLFTGWIGPACGLPDFNFDLMDMFGTLGQFPDSMGESVGCKKKNKQDCKKRDRIPDRITTMVQPRATTRTKPKTTTKAEQTTTKNPIITTTTASTTKPSTTKPSTTKNTTSATPTPDCGPCNSPRVKRAAEANRWGVMYNRAAPNCILSTRDTSSPDGRLVERDDVVMTIEDGEDEDSISLALLLEKRASKTVTFDPPRPKYQLKFGTYHSAGRAAKEAVIDKFLGLEDDNCMSAKMGQEATKSFPNRPRTGGQELEFASKSTFSKLEKNRGSLTVLS